MNLDQFSQLITSNIPSPKSFLPVNFGCRVNAAEINLMSQLLVNQGYHPASGTNPPGVIIVNTCSVTKKGELESLGKVRHLRLQHPQSLIIVTGCANLNKISHLDRVFTFDNKEKEELLGNLRCAYSPDIKDKFSQTHRYLLKIQSGCTQFCTYCTVPHQRQYLWSLPLNKAVETVNQAVTDGYTEVIITGVNLDQYQPGLSELVGTLLTQTDIQLISFGSIPINCINSDFISLFAHNNHNRLSRFLHIPIQSGSDKILKLMNRPYTRKKIVTTLAALKNADSRLEFGTDVIVGFPNENDEDFQQTIDICTQIGFTKIHTFKYSPRPNTVARFYYQKSNPVSKDILKDRSQQIRALTVK